MALHNEIGHLGENAACEYLVQHGYRIRERNWRLGNIEIDIIAEIRGIGTQGSHTGTQREECLS